MIPLLAILLAAPPTGDGRIAAPFDGDTLEIVTTARLAGAIHSLRWKGREFIDSLDHGRQLQSAASFDTAKPGPFWAECFNPTEAGSRDDSAGPTSTSRLLEYHAEGNRLRTRTQMAFWLTPGQKSDARPALNGQRLSDHLVAKDVTIGVPGFPNVLDYRVRFTVPVGERHTLAQFEAVTGYMPVAFGQFFAIEPDGTLVALPVINREQAKPILASTSDGAFAMGAFSPQQPSPGFETVGYGHFTFAREKVCKWNCVFRVKAADGVKPGDYAYRIFVAVGSREQVRAALVGLRTAPPPELRAPN